MSSKRIIFAALLITAIVTAAGSLRNGEAPKPRAFIGAYVVFIMLSLFAEAGPRQARLSAAFGMLIALAVGLKNIPAITGVGQAAGAANLDAITSPEGYAAGAGAGSVSMKLLGELDRKPKRKGA